MEKHETTKNLLDSKTAAYDNLKRVSSSQIGALEETRTKNERDIKQLEYDLEQERRRNIRCEEQLLANR